MEEHAVVIHDQDFRLREGLEEGQGQQRESLHREAFLSVRAEHCGLGVGVHEEDHVSVVGLDEFSVLVGTDSDVSDVGDVHAPEEVDQLLFPCRMCIQH